MELCISNIAWSSNERLIAYDVINQFGVKNIEIAPSLFFQNFNIASIKKPDNFDFVVQEILDRRIHPVSMQSILFGATDARLFGSNEERETLKKYLRNIIILAEKMQIHNLVFGSPTLRSRPDHLSETQAFELASSLFHDLHNLLDSTGVKIAIEANPTVYGTNFLNTFEEALRFIQFLDLSTFVSNFDMGEMIINDTKQESLQLLEDNIEKIGHVHISAPNLGRLDKYEETISDIINVLRVSKYTKKISLEMRRPDDGLTQVKSDLQLLIDKLEEPRC